MADRVLVHAALQRTGGEGVAQGVEGKVPDVSIFQQSVVVILEGFLLKVVTELVGDDKAIIGVLIPARILSCACCCFQRVSSSAIVRVSGIVRREFSFWVYRIRFRFCFRRRGLRTWQGD